MQAKIDSPAAAASAPSGARALIIGAGLGGRAGVMGQTPAARAPALNWDDLRIVLAIAESGTLSAAAVQLSLSHPTVSRRLQLIERRLGTRLFDRTPASLQLTSAGQEMCTLGLRLRDDIAALERRIGGRDAGGEEPIRLTAPDAVSEYLLPSVL
eukprot:gene7030-8728_t